MAAEGGQPLRAGTSLRERPLKATLAAAMRVGKLLGVTRVTDVTRMDRLGVPVFVSVRPRGLTLRVHAGKGLTPAAAQVGAAMEAIEFAVAERASAAAHQRSTSVGRMDRLLRPAARLADLIPRLDVACVSAAAMMGAPCEDLLRQREVLLPARLVHHHASQDADSPFHWNTNGLASGNSVDEATLHAALEVLERDAVVMNRVRDDSLLVDPSTLPSVFRRMAAQWAALGIDLRVRALPNAFGLPCFLALLHDRHSTDVNLMAGSGLHLDRGIALARAITEAAQSRLTAIHGGRDDVTTFFRKYAQGDDQARQARDAAAAERMASDRRKIGFSEVADAPIGRASVGDCLQGLLRRLAAIGFDAIFRAELTPLVAELNGSGLHVVKVVIARCEAAENHPAQLGARRLTRLLAHA